MDFKQLETFITVVELNSFYKAADKLYLTQPSVSARINTLEQELDVRLILRTTRNLTLTREGQHFYQYAKEIVSLTLPNLGDAGLLRPAPQRNLNYLFKFTSVNNAKEFLKLCDAFNRDALYKYIRWASEDTPTEIDVEKDASFVENLCLRLTQNGQQSWKITYPSYFSGEKAGCTFEPIDSVIYDVLTPGMAITISYTDVNTPQAQGTFIDVTKDAVAVEFEHGVTWIDKACIKTITLTKNGE